MVVYYKYNIASVINVYSLDVKPTTIYMKEGEFMSKSTRPYLFSKYFLKSTIILALLIVYKVLSEIAYINYIARIYYYTGININISVFNLLISYFFVICIYILLPKNDKKPSSYLIFGLYIFTYIPISSIYYIRNESTIYFMMISICLILIILLIKKIKLKSLIKFRIIKFNLLTTVFYLSCIYIVFFIIKYGIPSFEAFDLSKVYDIRDIREYSKAWKYIINWFSKAILPFLIVLSLHKKKYFIFFIVIIFQLIIYLYTANKTTLFSIPFVIFIWFLIKHKKEQYEKLFVVSLILLVVMSIFIYVIYSDYNLLSLFTYRIYSIPASISYNHYDFFLTNPKLLFSENFIGRIFGIDSPYTMTVSFLLGNGSNANTGMFGDAYANGGFIVMVLYSLIFSFILLIIDSLFYKRSKEYFPVGVATFSYSILILNDNSLTTTFITGGLFILFILNYFLINQSSV